MVRDTVAACTPARSATSRIVARSLRCTRPDPTRRPARSEVRDDAFGQQRLRAGTLACARADALPDYDRSAAPVIAHLGFGAFARAHAAVYADELLRRDCPALIRGVSLRSRQAQDQLGPQDGLFTVAVREPGEAVSLRVVGALSSMKTGPAAALEAWRHRRRRS